MAPPAEVCFVPLTVRPYNDVEKGVRVQVGHEEGAAIVIPAESHCRLWLEFAVARVEVVMVGDPGGCANDEVGLAVRVQISQKDRTRCRGGVVRPSRHPDRVDIPEESVHRPCGIEVDQDRVTRAEDNVLSSSNSR